MTIKYAIADGPGVITDFVSTACYAEYWRRLERRTDHWVGLWVGDLDAGQLNSLSAYAEWLNRYFTVRVCAYTGKMMTQANQFKPAAPKDGYSLEMQVEAHDLAQRVFVGLNLLRFATSEFQVIDSNVDVVDFVRKAVSNPTVMGIHLPLTGYYNSGGVGHPELFKSWMDSILTTDKWEETRMCDVNAFRGSGLEYTQFLKFASAAKRAQEELDAAVIITKEQKDKEADLVEALRAYDYVRD